MTLIYSSVQSIKPKQETIPVSHINDLNKVLLPGKSPKESGPYENIKQVWDIVYCSSQIGINPETWELMDGGVEIETTQICRNLKAILNTVNLWLKDVIKVVIYLKNIRDLTIVNTVYKDYFLLKPVRTIIEVANLEKNAFIAIEVTAHKDPKKVYPMKLV